MSENNNLALPGDALAVMEEYLPGQGVYIDEENGYLRASLIGKVIKDIKTKNIKIHPIKQKHLFPRPGSIVIGYVSSIRNDIAVITLFSTPKLKTLSTPLTGILHVSQASTGYTKTMYDILGLGDLVKVKVLSQENPFQLTMKYQNLGVILTTCSKCGAVLRKTKDNKLVCPRCGNVETRKTAPDYINLKKIQ